VSAEALCRRCRDGIAAARAAAAAGNALDLSGLDAEVVRMCDALAGIPREERGPVIAALRELLGELDLLTAALAEQQALRGADACGAGENGKAR
jgi:hypothetical protein